MSERQIDEFDIDAVADLLAVDIASALVSGGSYTYEDARRTNDAEGWTYERKPDGERVESMQLGEEELSSAWLTANRRVDNATSPRGPTPAGCSLGRLGPAIEPRRRV